MRWNTKPRFAVGPDGSWLPTIAPEVKTLGGAQECATPFLDPFARARRNPNPTE